MGNASPVQLVETPHKSLERKGENAVVVKSDSKPLTPEAQLQSFIDRFDPKDQKLIRSIRAAVRKRFPTANELGYDYGSHVVISYSATENAIDAVAAIDARADGVRLYLMQGPNFPDPKGLLMGTAGTVRYICLETASRLKHPDVEALIAAAIARAKVPMPSKGNGKLVIRGRAAKKTPRARPKK